MQITKRVILVEVTYSTISSTIGVLVFTAFYNLLNNLNIEIDFGGDKGPFLFALFIGMPISNIWGILLADKKSLNIKRANMSRILLAGIVNVVGILLTLFMMDEIGGGIFPLMYIATICFSVIAYNIKRDLPLEKR